MQTHNPRALQVLRVAQGAQQLSDKDSCLRLRDGLTRVLAQPCNQRVQQANSMVETRLFQSFRNSFEHSISVHVSRTPVYQPQVSTSVRCRSSRRGVPVLPPSPPSPPLSRSVPRCHLIPPPKRRPAPSSECNSFVISAGGDYMGVKLSIKCSSEKGNESRSAYKRTAVWFYLYQTAICYLLLLR